MHCKWEARRELRARQAAEEQAESITDQRRLPLSPFSMRCCRYPDIRLLSLIWHDWGIVDYLGCHYLYRYPPEPRRAVTSYLAFASQPKQRRQRRFDCFHHASGLDRRAECLILIQQACPYPGGTPENARAGRACMHRACLLRVVVLRVLLLLLLLLLLLPIFSETNCCVGVDSCCSSSVRPSRWLHVHKHGCDRRQILRRSLACATGVVARLTALTKVKSYIRKRNSSVAHVLRWELSNSV